MFKLKKGFTFVEITLVLGIISLIALITVPSYKAYKNDQIINENLSTLKYTIINTERLSYDEYKSYIIKFNKNGYVIQNSNKEPIVFHKNLEYVVDSVPNNEIIFLKDGYPQSNYVITLKNTITNHLIKMEISLQTGGVNIKW